MLKRGCHLRREVGTKSRGGDWNRKAIQGYNTCHASLKRQTMQAHAQAPPTSVDHHHQIISHSRQAVVRRLLSSLSSARKNELTYERESQTLRSTTPESPVLPSRTLEPAVLLPRRRPCPLCVVYREMFEKGQSPAKKWSLLSKRFKKQPSSSTSEAAQSPFDLDSANHPFTCPLSIATPDGAASPHEASTPLFARGSSDPLRLRTPIVSAGKERHDTSAVTFGRRRRLRS